MLERRFKGSTDCAPSLLDHSYYVNGPVSDNSVMKNEMEKISNLSNLEVESKQLQYLFTWKKSYNS